MICNWWNVFVRIAEPTEHKEALTSRPERLHLIATLVTHAGKKALRFCSRHEKSHDVKRAFTRLHTVFSRIEAIAGQLDRPRVWAIQLSRPGLTDNRAAKAVVNGLSHAPARSMAYASCPLVLQRQTVIKQRRIDPSKPESTYVFRFN